MPLTGVSCISRPFNHPFGRTPNKVMTRVARQWWDIDTHFLFPMLLTLRAQPPRSDQQVRDSTERVLWERPGSRTTNATFSNPLTAQSSTSGVGSRFLRLPTLYWFFSNSSLPVSLAPDQQTVDPHLKDVALHCQFLNLFETRSLPS